MDSHTGREGPTTPLMHSRYELVVTVQVFSNFCEIFCHPVTHTFCLLTIRMETGITTFKLRDILDF